MKAKAIQEMTDKELNDKLTALRQELFNLRFSHVTGQLENPKQITNCKRDIARVLTELRSREQRQQKA